MCKFPIVIAMLALLVASNSEAWPKQASPYRKIWSSEWRRAGLHPDYRTWFLGQITQESQWDREAVSPAGAKGLAQFMGGTVRLMERAYGEELQGLGGPYEPKWAIRAFLLLMRENVLTFKYAPERILRYRFASSAYNGGPGYLMRERRAAGNSWDWDVVRANCRRFRSRASCNENVAYSDHALRYAPRFIGY